MATVLEVTVVASVEVERRGARELIVSLGECSRRQVRGKTKHETESGFCEIRPAFATCCTETVTQRLLTQKYRDPRAGHIGSGVCAECGSSQPPGDIGVSSASCDQGLPFGKVLVQ